MQQKSLQETNLKPKCSDSDINFKKGGLIGKNNQVSYLHPRSRRSLSLVHVTLVGRLGSDTTLQWKLALEPLKTDWCVGA